MNTISVSGNARLTYSVSDGIVSESQEILSTRSIANGTDSGQANVAWRGQITISAGQAASIDLRNLADSALGYTGKIVISTLREVFVVNKTTTAGAYVLWGVIGPYDTTAYASRINRGGEYRVADYLDGVTITNGVNSVIYCANPSGVSVTIDVGFVGIGTYVDN